MAMIEWVDRRLNNWARWKVSGGRSAGGLGFASLNWGSLGGASGAPGEAVIPTWSVEASETDSQVVLLPGELKRTVELYYLETESRAQLSVRLCCSVSTVDARLTRAHKMLSDAFNEIDAAAASRRDALAASARASRP